jgi:hypothetical protein
LKGSAAKRIEQRVAVIGLPFAISRGVYDIEYFDFLSRFVHFIDNEIGRLDQLTCAWVKARPPHVLKARRRKSANALADAPDHLGGSARPVLGDPLKDMIEVSVSLLADNNLHTPKRRSRSSNSASEIVFGSFSARRRRSSASCSSLNW